MVCPPYLGFQACMFACSLEFVHGPQIHTCGTFMVILGHAQTSGLHMWPVVTRGAALSALFIPGCEQPPSLTGLAPRWCLLTDFTHGA